MLQYHEMRTQKNHICGKLNIINVPGSNYARQIFYTIMNEIKNNRQTNCYINKLITKK